MTNQGKVKVLILGGGIHGVGVLHDLVSRGQKDVLLLEKNTIGSGTSSKSTKLVHGGLRYLEHPRDFPLVHEALKERELLCRVVPDIVHPLEFYFPILKSGGKPGWLVRMGLSLYDLLASGHQIGKSREVPPNEALKETPFLEHQKFSRVLSFYDGQMDDLALAKRVGASAMKLGGQLREGAEARQIHPIPGGWRCQWTDSHGIHVTEAQFIINAMGPWSNKVLEASGITPKYSAINNKGIHIITRAISDQKVGCFLQSPEDGRIFFLLPWMGSTLIGTTESLYQDDLDDVKATDKDVEYLIERCNRYLKEPIQTKDIRSTFAGLRWLPTRSSDSLSAMSRSHVLGIHHNGPGFLLTIYGGKYTTYRSLSESIGDLLSRSLGEFRASQTKNPASWVTSHESFFSVPSIDKRFAKTVANG